MKQVYLVEIENEEQLEKLLKITEKIDLKYVGTIEEFKDYENYCLHMAAG